MPLDLSILEGEIPVVSGPGDAKFRFALDILAYGGPDADRRYGEIELNTGLAEMLWLHIRVLGRAIDLKRAGYPRHLSSGSVEDWIFDCLVRPCEPYHIDEMHIGWRPGRLDLRQRYLRFNIHNRTGLLLPVDAPDPNRGFSIHPNVANWL